MAEVWRYTKLFWINTGPYNNLTARKFVLRLSEQARSWTPPRRRRGGGAGSAPAAARRRPPWPGAWRRPSSTRHRPDGHQQDAGRRWRHPARQRQQPVRRRDDGRPRGLRGALSAELAAGEADGRLVEEVYRIGGRYDDELPRIVRPPGGGDPVRDAVVRRGAARARPRGIAPARTATAPRSTSPGCRPPTRRWTR